MLSSFFEKINPELLKQNDIEINNLANQFKIPYWNLPLSKSDYYVCDHLNRNGYKIFSNELNFRLNTYNKSFSN